MATPYRRSQFSGHAYFLCGDGKANTCHKTASPIGCLKFFFEAIFPLWRCTMITHHLFLLYRLYGCSPDFIGSFDTALIILSQVIIIEKKISV
jgi:hypothetical protein